MGEGAIIAQIINNVKCFLFNVKKMQLKLLDFLVWYIDLSFNFFCGGPPQANLVGQNNFFSNLNNYFGFYYIFELYYKIHDVCNKLELKSVKK